MRFLLALAFVLVGGCGGNRALDVTAPPGVGGGLDLAPVAKGDMASTRAVDLAAPAAADFATSPDLMPPGDTAPACGGAGQPCCAANRCAAGQCMTQGDGTSMNPTCIVAGGCGGYVYPCCDANGNPGPTSTLGFCAVGYWCHAGTCR